MLYCLSLNNSTEIAHEIVKISINEQIKMITLDIKDIYINLTVKGILRRAKTWLQKTDNNQEINNK